MPAPRELRQLVDRYVNQRDAYRSPAYNETQLRREFLDPLFRLLGWDIDNEQGFAEAYKDVVHEETLRIGDSTKAPDYAFRIGGTRKFFLEAKKPATPIDTDDAPAFQLRRYAWSATLPISILSNFEQLAVYDTRVRPHKGDRASTARVLLVPHTEFVAKWDELQSVFSREAVLNGSFDKFAESSKLKKGTARFDDAFLNDIEDWRKALAKGFAQANPDLDHRQLNAAVQITLDRIIFLRIAEDRGIESYGRLRELADTNGIYERLTRVFRQADDKYNSGLFHFRDEGTQSGEPPDTLTPALSIDDNALKTILRNLYYPESPYEFSVVSLDVLGQVYERFLGKQIHLTRRGITIEEKPLVRKAGGVFYTPTYVVDFIVANTIGPLLKGKRPGPRGGASQIRILDPACGSGSFLLSAFQYLLNWHRDKYIDNGPARHRRELVQTAGGGWVLTIDEKKRILLNNIFGVDIDEQAVEVTKLSLLLKVLEGESSQTIERQLRLFHERALPNLASNIRCGNSLVDTDWYGGGETHIDQRTAFAVNPFNWKNEFPTVFQSRDGFDVVIGNPPYVSLQTGFIAQDLQSYLANHYKSYERITDYFAVFLERAHEITADGGYYGMIVPSTVMGNLSFTKLRELILNNASMSVLAHLGDGVFRDAVVPTCIIAARKQRKPSNSVRVITDIVDLTHERFQATTIKQSRFLAQQHFALNVHASDAVDQILDTVRAGSVSLDTILNIKEGIKTGNDEKFLSDKRIGPRSKKVLKGRDIEQFLIAPARRFIDYDTNRLSRPQTPDHFEVPEKLLIRRVGDRLIAAYDDKRYYCVHTLYTARAKEEGPYTLKFVLGLLNSKLLNFVYRKTNPQKGKVFPEVRIFSLNQLPIPSLASPAQKARAAKIASLADRAIATTGTLAQTSAPHDRDVLGRQLAAIRDQLDAEVFALYGLSSKQIEVVDRFYAVSYAA